MTITQFLWMAAIGFVAIGEAELIASEQRSFGPEASISKVELLKVWGREGDGEGELNIPINVAISPEDELFVTDHYNNRVVCFDPDGKFVRMFSVLPNPGGIAVDPQLADGERKIYLSHFPVSRLDKEKRPDRVSVYSTSGKFQREWGRSGKAEGEFSWPGGMAISPKGVIAVADQSNHRIQLFTPEAKFVFGWGKWGKDSGEFGGNVVEQSRIGGPNFVAYDRAGNLYVTEANMGRVQKFDPDGRYLLSWGTNEEKEGHFGGVFNAFKTNMQGPLGIAVDAKGKVWVTSISGRIQQFSPEGKFLRGFGGKQGVEPGEFFAPHGIAIDSQGRLVIVDTYNHRLQKFDVGP